MDKCKICDNYNTKEIEIKTKYENKKIIKFVKSNSKMHINKLSVVIYYICDLCISDTNNYIDLSKIILSPDDFKNVSLFINNKNLYISKSDYDNIRDNNLNNIQKKRKKDLLSKIKLFKLQYIQNSICDGYIKYGFPNLDDVLEYLIKKQSEENNRLYELIHKLEQKNIEYDKDVPAFKKYIKCGGNIKEAIKNGELELLLVKNTNYLKLLEKYDDITAKDLSLAKYINKGGNKDVALKYANHRTTLYFD